MTFPHTQVGDWLLYEMSRSGGFGWWTSCARGAADQRARAAGGLSDPDGSAESKVERSGVA
jgi:hypothetical protein